MLLHVGVFYGITVGWKMLRLSLYFLIFGSSMISSGEAVESPTIKAPWEVAALKPSWSEVEATRTRRVDYDSSLSVTGNGQRLVDALAALVPGDRLVIAPGTYSLARKCSLNLRGTAEKPIWIVGDNANGAVVITRPDARQNVLNLGESSRSEYVALRNLEITGGSTLIRFYDCQHIWLDRCHLHHSAAEGITTNSRDTSYFFITGNHFHDFKEENATGEAMYLGGNHGKAVMSYSVIAGNHVHDCGGKQGDGIELKQGSHHNWIYKNHVHDTNYPCIIVYGTGGNGLNRIEGNLCYRSGDNTMQVQGEAVVCRNVLLAAEGAAFASTDHQGKTSRLSVVHNTIVSSRRGVNLSSWNARDGMVLANNAIYTDRGEAIRFPAGAERVVVAGNVVTGNVSGVSSGFVSGVGLEDFVNVRWDGSQRDARIAKKSSLRRRGASEYAIAEDFIDNHYHDPPSSGALAAVE